MQVFGVDKRIRQQHLPNYISPYYVLPNYIPPYYVLPNYIPPYYVLPNYIPPYYVLPNYISPYYVLPNYISPLPCLTTLTYLYISLEIESDFQATRYVCWTMSAFGFNISLCVFWQFILTSYISLHVNSVKSFSTMKKLKVAYK
jgi:hypothetical protein